MPKKIAVITGDQFCNLTAQYFRSLPEKLDIKIETNAGARFVNTARRMDIVMRNPNNNRYVGLECKIQMTPGTTDQKMIYTKEDCAACPFPTLIVFAGDGIRIDLKAQLIASGRGLEAKVVKDKDGNWEFVDPDNLILQYVYTKLGLNWFPYATGINGKSV